MPENENDLFFLEDEDDNTPEPDATPEPAPAPEPAPKQPTQQELDQQRYNAQRQPTPAPTYDPLNDFANDSVGFVQRNARDVAREEAAIEMARMKYPELRNHQDDIAAELQAVTFAANMKGERLSPSEAIERGIERFRKLNPDKASAQPGVQTNSQVYRMSTNMDVNSSQPAAKPKRLTAEKIVNNSPEQHAKLRERVLAQQYSL